MQCQCGGEVEASTRLYLDIDGTVEDDRAIITTVSLSALNDRIGDLAVNVEGELRVSCADCGKGYDPQLSADLLAQVGRALGHART